MYFCPCPCSDPHDPEAEETARVVLPRNLSYVQESYLDRYSVSAGFVHDPKSENNGRCEQQQLAQEEPVTCGRDPGSGERTPLAFSSASNVISTNVEDETIALLSILKAKDLRVEGGSEADPRCDFASDNKEFVRCAVPLSSSHISFREDQLSNFNGVGAHAGPEGVFPFSYSKWTANSIGFLDERGLPSSLPQSQPALNLTSSHHCPAESSTDTKTHSLPTASVPLLLSPASRVASRLSSLLQTPPNESMEAERNGTSVDGDKLSAAIRDTHSAMQAPVGLGEDMDRGCDIDRAHDVGQVKGNGSLSDIVELNPTVSDQSKTDTHIKSESGKVFLDGHPPRSQVLDIASNRPYHPTGSPPGKGTYRQKTSNASGFYESPDSDAFSEEGVFVNMMDDLVVADGGNESNEGQYNRNQEDDDSGDENDKSISTSVKSDETCLSVDSMFMSPEEGELEEDIGVGDKATAPVQSSEVEVGPPRKMSLQEAISRAASDLSRISIDLYGTEALLGDERAASNEDLTADTQDRQAVSGRANLLSWGRSSPVRTQKDLKLTITDYSSSSSSSITSDQLSKIDSGSTDLGLMDPMNQGPESPVYEETEFNFNRKALRKSSSLKTNKTPPGTPHRKKAVRFADAMGLDLESVRHVLNTNSPPKIPPSAMADLQAGLSEDRKEIGSKYLCPCFNQPGASDDFYQRVLGRKVCLENAIITDLTITGFVRVANITYHKSVRVRYTDNAWATFHDIAASYVQSSCDGPTDRFSFSLVAPAYFVPGHRLEFAISYNAEGTEYWDNNGGENYVFECFAKTVPTESESAWMHFL